MNLLLYIMKNDVTINDVAFLVRVGNFNLMTVSPSRPSR